MTSALTALRPRPGVAMQHQITGFVRELIREGRLSPNEKLPTIRELAAAWDTNSFTVREALSPLVREGMIVRRPRLGTFVGARQAILQHVGLYRTQPPHLRPEDGFNSMLHAAMCRVLGRAGLTVTGWLDPREQSEQRQPLPALLEAVERRQIQALIATSLNGESRDWLANLGLPLAMMTDPVGSVGVGLDYAQMTELAVAHLAQRGCTSVGLITHRREPPPALLPVPGPDSLRGHFLAAAQRHGLVTRPEWIAIPEASRPSLEECGYHLCKCLWRQPEHPAGLFVFSDAVARGVFHALLELQVAVPGELQLAVHRNDEVDIFSPMPVAWLEVRVEALAEALLQQVRALFEGRPVAGIRVPVRLYEHVPRGRLTHVL